MRYRITLSLAKDLNKIRKRDGGLYGLIKRKLEIFEYNEKHPSLRLHKLKGELGENWSISVTMGFRMLFYIEEDEAVFYKMGKHDQVYRVN